MTDFVSYPCAVIHSVCSADVFSVTRIVVLFCCRQCVTHLVKDDKHCCGMIESRHNGVFDMGVTVYLLWSLVMSLLLNVMANYCSAILFDMVKVVKLVGQV